MINTTKPFQVGGRKLWLPIASPNWNWCAFGKLEKSGRISQLYAGQLGLDKSNWTCEIRLDIDYKNPWKLKSQETCRIRFLPTTHKIKAKVLWFYYIYVRRSSSNIRLIEMTSKETWTKPVWYSNKTNHQFEDFWMAFQLMLMMMPMMWKPFNTQIQLLFICILYYTNTHN